ncbi:unnamed protein product [Ceratitis capitata]|uniref:(Mediterranean fruit fly) hypothetical protein n=1 Tax=Ceratitis capitata TaxID=7213 RepID=A0A811UCN4_CERCA|nr:unnamed protein product [Ceratitis capitata]
MLANRDVDYSRAIAEQVAGQKTFDEIIFSQANPEVVGTEMDLDDNASCSHSTTASHCSGKKYLAGSAGKAQYYPLP